MVQSTDTIAQQTHRASGRTAQVSNVTIHEPQALKSQHNYLNFSMETNNAQTSYEQAFTWSPSWNSNQAILQSQQEVNGELSCAVSENHLTFIFNDHLEEQVAQLWSTPAVYEEKPSEKIIFIQNLPWFLADEQAKLLPEFILMFAGNEIQISNALADENHWQAKQVLKIDIHELSVFAVIKINNELNKEIILASIFELPNAVNNVDLTAEEMRLASSDEVVDFHKRQSNRHQKAKQDQQSILARLKSNDQNIPISLLQSPYIVDKQTNTLLGENDA